MIRRAPHSLAPCALNRMKLRAFAPARALSRAMALAVALALACLAPARATAQAAADELVSLLADSVQVQGNSTLAANGNIEIFYQGTRVTAQSLRYDRRTETLDIGGPITIDDGDGSVILADSGALDADLRNGILRSARLVLNQQLQLAASEINRVEGRYTQLYKTVASSCQVCAASETPLWQIRAERVVHDTQTRQLYFDKARFELAGVPIFYLPRLRIPDPTVKRATGFLVPSLRNTTELGTGIKMPYFITLGDHADITLAPFVSLNSATLEARYRQAFRYGDIEINTAVSSDDLTAADYRGYLFAEGSFRLPRSYRLSFDLELTSDPAYLQTYGLSGKDRLDSEIAVRRVSRDEYISARVINIRTLRDSELATADQLPFLLGEVIIERRYDDPYFGGEAGLRLSFDSYTRQSDADIVGRDGLHFGLSGDWTREWNVGAGVLARVSGDLSGDLFYVLQDSSYPSYQANLAPSVAADLRWPLIRQARDGSTDLLEPVAQLAWTGGRQANVPNDDSTLVEFDGGNLLSLNRFPGSDRRERGLRSALGFRWSRLASDSNGLNSTFAAARVFRLGSETNFTQASGLRGTRSDWLLGAHMTLGDNQSLTTRALLDDDLTLTKSETRLAWTGEKLDLASTYIYVIPDADENRSVLISELSFDTSYRLNRHWTGQLKGRYDFITNRAASAAVGLVYRNECITVDLSVNRRFTSAGALEPSTSAAFQVSLAGFGGGEDTSAYRRQCGR